MWQAGTCILTHQHCICGSVRIYKPPLQLLSRSGLALKPTLSNFHSDLLVTLKVPAQTVFFSLFLSYTHNAQRSLPCCGFNPCHHIRVDSSNHCAERTACKTWQGLTAGLNAYTFCPHTHTFTTYQYSTTCAYADYTKKNTL